MRQNLSRYAQRTRKGESFVITDRGGEVARLVPAPMHATEIDRLVAERGARRGQGDLVYAHPGAPSNEVLDEIRGERA